MIHQQHRGNIVEVGFDFREDGYFAEFPADTDDDELLVEWRAFRDDFTALKHGDFSPADELARRVGRSAEPILNSCVSALLSDAAPDRVCNIVAAELADAQSFERARHLARIVGGRGRTSDVLLLLELTRRFATIRDVDFFTLLISIIIDIDNPDHVDVSLFPSYEDYATSVQRRCHALALEYGADVPFFKAEPVGARRLAEKLLVRLRMPHLPEYWRERLEAMTGLDCSAFYKFGSPQPLTAAAIVEDFLESGEADKFEPGVRYFFGHRIPN